MDICTFIGTIGLFLTLFLLFARFLPMIAISEVKGVASPGETSFAGQEAEGNAPMNRCPDPADLIAQMKDKLGIGADKVYAVMGEFSEPDDLVEAGRKIREHGLYQDRRHDAVSRCTASTRPSAFRIPRSAGS